MNKDNDLEKFLAFITIIFVISTITFTMKHFYEKDVELLKIKYFTENGYEQVYDEQAKELAWRKKE